MPRRLKPTPAFRAANRGVPKAASSLLATLRSREARLWGLYSSHAEALCLKIDSIRLDAGLHVARGDRCSVVRSGPHGARGKLGPRRNSPDVHRAVCVCHVDTPLAR